MRTNTIGRLVAVLVALFAALTALAGEMSVEFDSVSNTLLLDTHFGHFGRKPAKYSSKDGPGVRFKLSNTVRNDGQFGVYSLFGLTGDFEVSATFQVLALPAPTSGYGVSFGMTVDDQQAAGIVSLARGRRVREPDGYLVTRGKGREAERVYETNHHATAAKTGRMVLRREKSEIVCLVADNLKDPPREIDRLAYTDGPVRQVRFFADPGGAPATIDAILAGIRVKAEAISGDLPRREESHALAWWLAAIAVGMTAAVVVVVRRKRNSEQ